MNVQKMLNGTLAGQMALALAKKDGSENSISASVWNDFVKDKGGKTINDSISTVNAMKSIMTYAVRESGKTKGQKSINDIAQDWFNKIGNSPASKANGNSNTNRANTPPTANNSTPPPAASGTQTPQPAAAGKQTPPPAKDKNLPASTDTSKPAPKDNKPPALNDAKKRPASKSSNRLLSALYAKRPQKAKQTINTSYGEVEFNQYGYIGAIYNKNGQVVLQTHWQNGMLGSYEEYTYDKRGNRIRETYRKNDGKLSDCNYDFAYVDFTYDNNGNRIREIYRKSDGTLRDGDDYAYVDYTYDNNGNCIREIWRKKDGTLDDKGAAYIDYTYDNNGNQTETRYDINGKKVE